MNKLITYTRYFLSYLRHGDLGSILASFNYVMKWTTHRKDRQIKSSIGLFYCRKGTNDFQFANYFYEWGVKKYVLKNLQEFDVFIDGGSCTGDYSILLSKRGVRSIAFEPVADNFRILMKNLELNQQQEKVMAFPLGLGHKNETVRFEIDKINTGASHKTVLKGEKQEDVEIKTLDSLLPELNLKKEDRILFKLDVEGMEIEAIQGAQTLLKEYPHITLIVEKKHSGPRLIEQALNKIASFDCQSLDAYNLIATKIN